MRPVSRAAAHRRASRRLLLDRGRRSGRIRAFRTYEIARADRDAVSEEALTPAEALVEAERNLGMAGWNDVQTGEPAEGASPHLPPE
jgi:hypothetical protein